MLFFGIAKQWERHAVFFLGRFARMVGPGLYFYIPLIERVLFKIDKRIITYVIPSQRALTKDNIPVDVDAAKQYEGQPIALALRSMNMLYEMCMEGRSTMVFVPTERAGAGMPGIIRSGEHRKTDRLWKEETRRHCAAYMIHASPGCSPRCATFFLAIGTLHRKIIIGLLNGEKVSRFRWLVSGICFIERLCCEAAK
jgi:hypothetical protein